MQYSDKRHRANKHSNGINKQYTLRKITKIKDCEACVPSIEDLKESQKRDFIFTSVFGQSMFLVVGDRCDEGEHDGIAEEKELHKVYNVVIVKQNSGDHAWIVKNKLESLRIHTIDPIHYLGGLITDHDQRAE